MFQNLAAELDISFLEIACTTLIALLPGQLYVEKENKFSLFKSAIFGRNMLTSYFTYHFYLFTDRKHFKILGITKFGK